MHSMKMIVTGVMLLLSGAVLGYWHAKQRAADDAGEAAARQADERKILYWHDPMVPGARFDKPGKSPFMDMQLVPVYADESAGAAVRVNPEISQTLGIRIGKAEKMLLQTRLGAVGGVAFDEQLAEVIEARVEGYVTKLRVKAPLTQVRKGQPLADILAPDWLAAQEEYLALLDAQFERSDLLRRAARQRLLVLGVPEAAVAELEARRTAGATTTLHAPQDGVVTELAVREGAAFMPGAPLVRINGLKTVWVNAQVPEAQVSMIPVGSSVAVRAVAWPARTFKGQVAALLPDVDPQTRTLPVRVVVDNDDFKLAPGMFVALEFSGASGGVQLVVPSEAVIATGERTVVIVALQAGGFDVAEVTVGTEMDGKTAVHAGLKEGESIVLSGQFLIDSEASLKATVSRLSAVGEGKPAEPRP